MDYDRICKDILNLDKKIRFAAICDDAGETRYGGMREGMSSPLTPEETRKSVQGVSLRFPNYWRLPAQALMPACEVAVTVWISVTHSSQVTGRMLSSRDGNGEGRRVRT